MARKRYYSSVEFFPPAPEKATDILFFDTDPIQIESAGVRRARRRIEDNVEALGVVYLKDPQTRARRFIRLHGVAANLQQAMDESEEKSQIASISDDLDKFEEETIRDAKRNLRARHKIILLLPMC